MSEKQYGRDVDAPVRHVMWQGQSYEMIYNNRAARIVEDVYADEYGHPEMGYYEVLTELAIPKHRAVLAIAYATIRAGGAKCSFEEFEDTFQITDIEGFTEIMRAAVLEAMPQGDGKKAEAAPATPGEDSPGRG